MTTITLQGTGFPHAGPPSPRMGIPSPREGQRAPVRRQSRLAGQCEAMFWRRTDRRMVERIVLAARRFELAGKPFGRRTGPLGHVAIEIMELFSHTVHFRTGRLDPSIDYLMGKLRRSRDAIVSALQALRRHGFLDWLRRFEPTGNEGRGPQVRQVTNAYRLSLPRAAARLLGRYYGDTPPPDDVNVMCRDQAAAYERDELEARLTELTDFPPCGGDVRQGGTGAVPDYSGEKLAVSPALLRLLERESARRTETQSDLFFKRQDKAESA